MASNESIKVAFVNIRHTAVALRQRIVTKAERHMCDEIIFDADFWVATLEAGARVDQDDAIEGYGKLRSSAKQEDDSKP